MKDLNEFQLYKLIKQLIVVSKERKELQKNALKNFYLTDNYISKKIDSIRSSFNKTPKLKKKELKTVYDLLIKKELSQANNLLINLRQFGVLHPEYLFLMSLFLMESGRIYLAIDSLLLSLKVDNTPEVMKKNNFESTTEKLVEKISVKTIPITKPI